YLIHHSPRNTFRKKKNTIEFQHNATPYPYNNFKSLSGMPHVFFAIFPPRKMRQISGQSTCCKFLSQSNWGWASWRTGLGFVLAFAKKKRKGKTGTSK